VTVYATATICGKWALPFYVPVHAEDSVAKTQRSYLHYVQKHRSLVAAKCLATQWILESLPSGLQVREYFGGAGVVSTIVHELLNPIKHCASDRDARCVEQLSGLLGAENAWQENAREGMCELYPYDLKILDFPSFTVLRIEKHWHAQWEAVFVTQPTAVIFTDTACSYLPVHRKTYEAFFHAPITDKRSYTQAFSQFLMTTRRYSIQRAAYRARNAAYYLCVPGESVLEEAEFPDQGAEADGFAFV